MLGVSGQVQGVCGQVIGVFVVRDSESCTGLTLCSDRKGFIFMDLRQKCHVLPQDIHGSGASLRVVEEKNEGVNL